MSYKRYSSPDPRHATTLIECPRCFGKSAYCSYCEGSGQVDKYADIEIDGEEFDKDEYLDRENDND